VTKQLGDFKSGARGGSSNAKVMHGVAQTLGDDDVQALSTYLSTL
jgi:cytochrome c553